MAISDCDIVDAVTTYLAEFPGEAAQLAEPLRLLSHGANFADRRTFPLHITTGALLVRCGEVLLVNHRAYGLLLQPGGHLEPTDQTLIGAAARELAEETGVDLDQIREVSQNPVYIEFGRVPPRAEIAEPEHFHLDLGYCFSTASADIGDIQESEVTSAAWYPLPTAERLVGPRIARCRVGNDRGGHDDS